MNNEKKRENQREKKKKIETIIQTNYNSILGRKSTKQYQTIERKHAENKLLLRNSSMRLCANKANLFVFVLIEFSFEMNLVYRMGHFSLHCAQYSQIIKPMIWPFLLNFEDFSFVRWFIFVSFDVLISKR